MSAFGPGRLEWASVQPSVPGNIYFRMSVPSGTILPDADVLNQFEHGRFVLSNLAAKRAKQLKDGAPPLVRCESNHPLSVALAEIAAGKIRAVIVAGEPELAIVEAELPVLSDEVLAERGVLLPALEESETELVAALTLHDDDEAKHGDDEAEIATLADLLDDTAAEETAPMAEADSDTVSLSDVAEQENLEEEEEHAS